MAVVDHRVRCDVEDPDEVLVQDANAFRTFADGGNEHILDFIHCPVDAAFGEVVARLRVHRDVLQSIHDRLTGSVTEPETVLFSVPLGG
tara:strand:+ start:18849 stop:19115 length:267 start_codon:yes stop_codon:yes gene_type:complete